MTMNFIIFNYFSLPDCFRCSSRLLCQQLSAHSSGCLVPTAIQLLLMATQLPTAIQLSMAIQLLMATRRRPPQPVCCSTTLVRWWPCSWTATTTAWSNGFGRPHCVKRHCWPCSIKSIGSNNSKMRWVKGWCSVPSLRAPNGCVPPQNRQMQIFLLTTLII
jgi:hypothetical protein